MMTHGELHKKVREVLRIERISRRFGVSTSSTEDHPGRVGVEWAIYLAAGDNRPAIYLLAPSAAGVLERFKLALAPSNDECVELDAIGDPPCVGCVE